MPAVYGNWTVTLYVSSVTWPDNKDSNKGRKKIIKNFLWVSNTRRPVFEREE